MTLTTKPYLLQSLSKYGGIPLCPHFELQIHQIHYACSIKYRDNLIFSVVCLTMLSVALNDWMIITKLDGKEI